MRCIKALFILAKPHTSDAVIGFKTSALGVFGGIDVAQIGHVGDGHLARQSFQIQRAEFIPFGQDHYKIGFLPTKVLNAT